MSGHLTIRRFRSEYRIDRDAAEPLRIRDECDSAVRAHLSGALASMLARWCDRDDGSVWLVRRLEIDLAVNVAWDQEELARAIALGIARSLANSLTGDGDGASAIRFPDRTAYLARFLVDAATGDAWSCWYYAPFDGLRLLPTSTALRTAVTEDPQLGLAAMQRLSDFELVRVTGALSATDRETVLDRFATIADPADAAQCIAAAWFEWRRSAAAYTEDSVRALALFVRAANGAVRGRPLRVAIEALVAARRFVASRRRLELEAALTALRASDRSRLANLAGNDAPILFLLAAASPELLAEIFAPDDTWAAVGTDVINKSGATPFGGMFFLLPQLAELPVEDWVASWPAPEGTASASALRLLVIAKCMGDARAGMAFSDPVLRRLLRIGPELTLPGSGKWLRKLGPERRQSLRAALQAAAETDGVGARIAAADRDYLALPRGCGIAATWDGGALSAAACLVLRRFARRLPGFAGSSLAYLYRNFLDVSATVEEEPDRIVARVGRPPLYLVLNMTGMIRTVYTVPGEARPVAVFARD